MPSKAPDPIPAKTAGMGVGTKDQLAAPAQGVPTPGMRDGSRQTVMDKMNAETETPGKAEKYMGLATNPIRGSPELVLAELTVSPTMNAAMLVDAFTGNLIGPGTADLCDVADSLRQTAKKVQDGDLAALEAMLVSQANALQVVFTSYAVKAQVQTNMRNMESFMSLALKAQAQSRATISALVDLKYPRQATFVKQANIANGPQQVNNGVAVAPAHEGNRDPAVKLSGPTHELPQDTGTSSPTGASDSYLAAVGKVHRTKVRRG